MSNTVYNLDKVYISNEAKKEAEELIIKMKDNLIEIDILPNSYENFTGELETQDYLSFCHFLESRKGRCIIKMMEEEII